MKTPEEKAAEGKNAGKPVIANASNTPKSAGAEQVSGVVTTDGAQEGKTPNPPLEAKGGASLTTGNPENTNAANADPRKGNDGVKVSVDEESRAAAIEKSRTGQAADATEQAQKEAAAKVGAEARIKAEADFAAADQAERDRINSELQGIDPTPNPQLSQRAQREQDRILRADRDENDVPVREKHAEARTAAEKLRLIALDFPRSTPDEHVIFGRGGHKYTLGDLRNLTNTR